MKINCLLLILFSGIFLAQEAAFNYGDPSSRDIFIFPIGGLNTHLWMINFDKCVKCKGVQDEYRVPLNNFYRCFFYPRLKTPECSMEKEFVQGVFSSTGDTIDPTKVTVCDRWKGWTHLYGESAQTGTIYAGYVVDWKNHDNPNVVFGAAVMLPSASCLDPVVCARALAYATQTPRSENREGVLYQWRQSRV